MYSEIIGPTQRQAEKLKELEALGWRAVTQCEGTFNGAMFVERPEEGDAFYLTITGDVVKQP